VVRDVLVTEAAPSLLGIKGEAIEAIEAKQRSTPLTGVCATDLASISN
jgi:hypothetical protein